MSDDSALRSFLESDLVTAPTRAVLQARLGTPGEQMPRFFTTTEHETLRAVADRFFPQGDPSAIAGARAALDGRLAEGAGDGWRYESLPPDGEAMRRGLCGLEETARHRWGERFTTLDNARQEEILAEVQRGLVTGGEWHGLPPERFFEELLAELAALYYSHPQVQVTEIGSIGMADGRGWRRLGLNEREDWEPAPGAVPLLPPPPAPPPAEAPATPPLPRPCHPAGESVDAVIIGTGAGGSPLLARLAGAGLRVVALEAGRLWDPAHEFATDERAQEKLFWRDERLSGGRDPIFFGANNSGVGVGGSTLHWTAFAPRAHPDDLRLRSDFGVGADWPLTYADLAPYYDEVERFLGVSGPSPYPWDPGRTPYPLAPLPLNAAAQLMRRGCAVLGLRTSPAPNAALSGPYFQPGVGWRRACTNRGFCQAGCSVGAKASMDVTYLPAASQAGAEIRPECFVTHFERDARGRVSHVIYRRGEREERQACRAVFLCAGAIETPRLLLMNGLANASGQVGKNFMAHTGVQVWGEFEAETRPWKGIPGGLISEDTHRPQGADFAGGYLLQSLGIMPVTYATQVARGAGEWGERLQRRMRGYPHAAGINICGECLPSPQNFLELSEETDARGLPKPRVMFSNHENERRLTAHAETLMRAIWDAAGAQDVWSFPRNPHTLGTCRMGADPASSVVNSDGRVHEMPNFYLMDGSVFPSSLSVNPALTIMAVSLRTADRFLEKLKNG